MTRADVREDVAAKPLSSFERAVLGSSVLCELAQSARSDLLTTRRVLREFSRLPQAQQAMIVDAIVHPETR